MFLMLNLQVNIDIVKPPQKRINLTKPKKEYFRQICRKKGVNRTCALPICVTYNQFVTPIKAYTPFHFSRTLPLMNSSKKGDFQQN